MRTLFDRYGALVHQEYYLGLPVRDDWVGLFSSKTGLPIQDGNGCILVMGFEDGRSILYAIDLETDTAKEIVRH